MPMAVDADHEQAPAMSEELVEVPAARTGALQKVLIVDDEPSVQSFVVRVLTRHGFDCLTASNAAEAITTALKERPSLTITDIRMPGSDGTWLLGQLKEQCPQMAVVMLSAVSEARTAMECLRAGADDYLVKPIEIEELLASTTRSLRRFSDGESLTPAT